MMAFLDAAIIGIIVASALTGEFPGFVWIVAGVLVFAGANFAILTVSVDGEKILLRFGPGLIRFTFSLLDVTSCRVVRNSRLAGCGIHYTNAGWLYNVSGLRGVEIETRSGKKYRIGSDEPEKLAAFIGHKLGAL